MCWPSPPTGSSTCVRTRAAPAGLLGWQHNYLGVDHACLYASGGYTAVTGGGYSFNSSPSPKKNKKRGHLAPPKQCAAASVSRCEAYQRPNEVGFGDGVRYDLFRLDEAAGDELMDIIATVGSSAEVPASFDGAKITE